MKYKLTDISFDNLETSSKELNQGTIINVTYLGQSLEFQTPKVIIQDIIREAGKEYFLLKINPNQACKKFVEKILELEKWFEKKWNDTVISIFDSDHFTVKIPFVSTRPNINVYIDGCLFNYYKLTKGMEIICLLVLDKLWKNDSIHYNLQVKEIMLINIV